MIFELALAMVALAVLGLSARWNWWRSSAGGIPVLMYHKIGDPPAGSKLKKLWVSKKDFRRQMAYLLDHGHHPVTLAEIARLLDGGKPVPTKAVVITFDDGYRNNLENALPILKEFGFRAVLFVVTNAAGKDNFWHDPSNETRIPMLSWDQAKGFKSRGGKSARTRSIIPASPGFPPKKSARNWPKAATRSSGAWASAR
jgi:hypothetical protein